jgi:hypothetical protein|tara:strand:- start:3987 stop:4295 length:309 start_codon:yes stop_codon:yes gene_type:complete
MKNNTEHLKEFLQIKTDYYSNQKNLTGYEKYFITQQKSITESLPDELKQLRKLGKDKYTSRIEKRLTSAFEHRSKLKWYKLRFVVDYLVYLEDKNVLILVKE